VHRVVPLKLPPKVRICAEPSRKKVRPASEPRLVQSRNRCGCSGVTSRAQGPHVASRERLVSNPTTMGGTSSGRRCCFSWSCPQSGESVPHSPKGLQKRSHASSAGCFHGPEARCVLVSHYLTNYRVGHKPVVRIPPPLSNRFDRGAAGSTHCYQWLDPTGVRRSTCGPLCLLIGSMPGACSTDSGPDTPPVLVLDQDQLVCSNAIEPYGTH